MLQFEFRACIEYNRYRSVNDVKPAGPTMTQIVAWYLPQFHAFPENDRFWGAGFTEWTCLNRAKPLCAEHQLVYPHADIGQYSLLSREMRAWQAQTAKAYGVFGFCYYHYWFGGKVLMQRPLELMLEDGEPDLPFCLSWANEPWTRRMNGGSGEVLVPEAYGDEDEWLAHFNYLRQFFDHPNYIRIDGKPVLLIYRLSVIPQLRDRLKFYRDCADFQGFDDLFIVGTLGNFRDDMEPYRYLVDAMVEFPPNWMGIQDTMMSFTETTRYYHMQKAYELMLTYPRQHQRQFLGLMPSFDSSPRNPQVSNVFLHGTPKLFRNALSTQLIRSTEPLLFVNAWNEWGEQAVLEPSQQHGYGYLEAIREVTRTRL